ncbi:hypothetical protein C8R48DRAFT_712543 [Suillus tomentosus]|nr:hypothetical protein C8R48DRAFT_712543 [Suillus tomentosus]
MLHCILPSPVVVFSLFSQTLSITLYMAGTWGSFWKWAWMTALFVHACVHFLRLATRRHMALHQYLLEFLTYLN